MSVSDPVADMLTKIRNASRAKLEKVDILCSKLKMEIVKILKTEGFIKNYKRIVENRKPIIRVFLRYDDIEQSAIHGLVSVSTPGRRVYYGYCAMPRVLNGYGVLIISTPLGVLTGEKAFLNKVGGEAICKVW